MKNKLQFLRAAQETALKLNAAKSSREKAGILTSDFDALKLDAKHYDEFAKQAYEQSYIFAQHEKILLEPEVKIAAPVKTESTVTKTIVGKSSD